MHTYTHSHAYWYMMVVMVVAGGHMASHSATFPIYSLATELKSFSGSKVGTLLNLTILTLIGLC